MLQKKYQAIMFQKQKSSNTQEFQRRHLHPYPAPDYPFNHSFPELLRHSRPVEAPGIPQLGQISPQFAVLPQAEGLEKNSYTQSGQYQYTVHNSTQHTGDSLLAPCVGVLKMFVLHDSGHVSLHCGSLGIEQSEKIDWLNGWLNPG